MDQKKQHEPGLEQMQSISDLSAWLGIPTKTIYKWTSDRHSGIPFYRLGKHLRFRFSEVESWLRKYRGSEGTREFAPSLKTAEGLKSFRR
jgi:excisionase family DNA binding protein